MIEHFLIHPRTLSTQLIFSLTLNTRITLISSFYRIDTRICRELLGKKLTHRIRKDLDVIAIRTHRSVLLCRRVFDNLKRITKRVEDAEEDIVLSIMNHFLLSNDLASQYAHIIFINHYKFDTTKRKLANLVFSDYEYGTFLKKFFSLHFMPLYINHNRLMIFIAASVFLRYFPASPESSLDEFDSLIVEDCRLLKIALFNHKDVLEKLRFALLQHLSRPSLTPSSTASSSISPQVLQEKITISAFKLLIRNVLAIGLSLSNSKEVRDIFLVVLERIVDPCISFGWDEQDVDMIMIGLVNIVTNGNPDLGGIHLHKYSKTVQRLFSAISMVAIRFMSSINR